MGSRRLCPCSSPRSPVPEWDGVTGGTLIPGAPCLVPGCYCVVGACAEELAPGLWKWGAQGQSLLFWVAYPSTIMGVQFGASSIYCMNLSD